MDLTPTSLSPTLALDFLFNSFSNIPNRMDLTLINDARSTRRLCHPPLIRHRSVLRRPLLPHSKARHETPAFALCDFNYLRKFLASHYFGLFINTTVPVVAPLLAVEFDMGRNPEFNDPDGNPIGIDLNNIESAITKSAGYYNSAGGFVPIQMRTGQNFRTWDRI
ncbi:hypothetical protein M0R45_021841 [Rubus argutus]|uniref:Legume lectin domain-containing protein n=1 Tax=Rubus argutus TaxID=59490 RepID=A0AAW1XDH7_RUBAR